MAEPGTAPTLWLIEPVADPDDQMWQDRPVWAEVVVAAQSPAFARLAAERRALPPDWTPSATPAQAGDPASMTNSSTMCGRFPPSGAPVFRMRHATAKCC